MKMKMANWKRNSRRTARRANVGQRALAGLLALVVILGLAHFSQPTAKSASGSAKDYEKEKTERKAAYNDKFDLTNLKWKNDSSRPYLYWQSDSFGGIKKENFIHVFAFEGETICFGSNISNSTLGVSGAKTATNEEKEAIKRRFGPDATIDIVLEDLDGNRITYDVVPNGAGHIPNVQTEVLAKTMEEVAGNKGNVGAVEYAYTPLTYTVHETGVYTFEFHSYDYNGTGGQAVKNDENFRASNVDNGSGGKREPNDNEQGGMVAAWDVSVFNEQGYKETGRVYADCLSFQENGGTIFETYYVLTSDNYIYRWDFKGVRPNTYNFFANNQGLLDNATGGILYKSVKELQNSRFDYNNFGVTYTYPGTPDTDLTKSYKIFFEMPDTDLEGVLYDKAVAPDPATNLKFVSSVIDEDGKERPGATYVGMGGWFQFDVENATTATLRIEFTTEIGGKHYAPVELSGVVTPYSTNRFFWDGRDGNGEVIPAGNYSITDISWTITTKAGEIHFPIHDVESADSNKEYGFTFTRVSPVYSRDGERLDKDGVDGAEETNIYTATKSVIYYDDSAIYYGEQVGRSGYSEGDIYVSREAIDKSSNWRTETAEGEISAPSGPKTEGSFYYFNNLLSSGSEYWAFISEYRKEAHLRVGDHSHTSNFVRFYDETGKIVEGDAVKDQLSMINWLDSAKYPVGRAAGGMNTFDYGISNYWTFVPGQPVKATDTTSANVDILPYPEGKKAANITGLVFYDNDYNTTSNSGNGTYNTQAGMDVALSGVTVNLYRQTDDSTPVPGKTYYTVSGSHGKWVLTPQSYSTSFPSDITVYELLKTSITNLEGRVTFEGVLYNETEGTSFIYEVKRPDSRWSLTTFNQVGKPLGTPGHEYGNYALYAYDKNEKGTEIQAFTLGTGADMVNPEVNLANYENHTATAIDVGYHFDTFQSFTASKAWQVTASKITPENVIFELSSYYHDGTHGASEVYERRSLSSIMSWKNTWNYLPSMINSRAVKFYISAEYYLDGGNLYKHAFELETESADISYKSFVGTAYKAQGTYTTMPSLNELGTITWDEVDSAPYTAVLDRNVGAAQTEITITNSDDPGVIEILKYTGAESDNNYLAGATFRLYTKESGDITIAEIKDLIDKGTPDAIAELAALQVGSATTRDNGRVAFSGLKTDKHYIIREVYPPAGYRAREVLYIVHPASCKSIPNHYHAVRPEEWDEETWDTWQLQNIYFGNSGDNNRALASIANIPASGDLAIRKQLEGRTWNDDDSFTFDVAFRKNDGTAISDSSSIELTASGLNYIIAGSTAVSIPKTEFDLFTDASTKENSLSDELLAKFLAGFDGTDNLTINNTCEYAQDTVSVNGMDDVKVSLADTKQSVGLIVNGDITYDSDGNPVKDQHPEDALMNTSTNDSGADTGAQKSEPHHFPAAGTYTFTINEKHPSETGTTDYTYRVYTVTVQVTRVLDPGEADGTTATLTNSYLRAEVQSMYYQELKEDKENPSYPSDYGSRMYYAGVAPTFTNQYHIQPAVQSTSYAIQVNFKGRLDTNGQPINKGEITENWLLDDKFSVTITGDDEATRSALKNGNIYIGGLKGNLANPPEQKKIDFNQTNVTNPNNENIVTDRVEKANEHIFTFEELDFRNIEFPVKWVFTEEATIGGVHYEAGDEVPENTEEGKNLVITITEAEAAALEGITAGNYLLEDALFRDDLSEYKGLLHPVESRTEDVVYHLTIELVNEGKGGITYDATYYSMVITLKNSADGSDSTDGIIDEMDLFVDRLNEKDEKIDKDGELVTDENQHYATCETDQHVVDTFAKWTKPEESFGATTGAKYSQYYVNNDGVIREVEKSADGKYYVQVGEVRYEIVAGDSGGEGNVIGFQTLKGMGVTFIVKKEAHSGDHTMVFNNVYETQGTWTPTIHKFVEGRDWGDGEEFNFTLTCNEWPGTYKPENGDQPLTINKATGSNENSGTFGAVTFNAPGTYRFTLSETLNQHNGELKIRDAITITVTASDEEHNGKLKLSVTGLDGSDEHKDEINGDNTDNVTSTINFVNAYSENGEFQIAIEKTLTGRDWTAGDSFTFTVELNEEAKAAVAEGKLTVPDSWIGSDGTYTVTVTNANVDGASSDAARQVLGTLNLSELRAEGGTYVFTIKEDTDGFAGKTLECRQPTVKLTVTAYSDEGTEGGYTGTILTYAYLDDDEKGKEDEDALKSPYVVPFTNRFYVDTLNPSTDVSDTGFKVEKEFTGRPGDEWKDTDKFNATVTLTSGNTENFLFKDGANYVPWDDATYGKVEFSQTVKSKTFDFRFFEVGEYVFTVSEENRGTTINGITYDGHTYTVTFDVTKSGADNHLTVSRTINGVETGTITFKNTYQATGTWTPTVTKELTGREWLNGDQFTFELACATWPEMGEADSRNYTYNPLKSVGGDGATVKTLPIGKPSSGKENSGSFDAITFTKPGDYTFTITEKTPGAGITVDGASEITITVKATDNGDGTLKLTVTGDGGTTTPGTASDSVATTVKFVNAYDESGDFPLSLSKLLTGRDWNEGEEFTFTIMPVGNTKDAIGAGKPITVPDEWTQDGDNYSVTVPGSASGKTDPTTGWETKTLDLGNLHVGNLGGKSATYTFVIEENISTFEKQSLYCAQPKIKLTVNANGEGLSGALAFSATYAYIVNDDDTGTGSETFTEKLVLPFTNRFYVETLDPGADVGDHGFTVAKSLTGRPGNAWNTGDKFTAMVTFSGADEQLENFQFKYGENYVPWEAKYGTVEFSDSSRSKSFDFRFFEKGEYKFTVKENVPTENPKDGITYDTNEYTVTFDVAPDPENGNRLTVTRKIEGGVEENVDGGTITVKNTYQATGTWTPKVTKELKGREWQTDEEFEFTLSCEPTDGVTLPTETTISVDEAHAKSGVSFGAVTFTKPGYYTFTITESGTGKGHGSNGKPADIKIEVHAYDNGDGDMLITVKGEGGVWPDEKTGNKAATTTVEFVNAYDEKGEFPLSLSKLLTGRDWESGETFSFTITPDDVAKKAITTNDTTGEAKQLTVPESWGSANEEAGAYTVKVGETGDTSSVGDNGWTTKTHSLGNLKVGNLGGKSATYTFDIEENISDFAGQSLYCAQPKIKLTVTANGDLSGALAFSATYAYIVNGEEGSNVTPTGDLVLPFTNRFYVETLDPGAGDGDHGFTVAKSFTGRPENAWLDSDTFTVNVAFDSENSTGKLTDVFVKEPGEPDYKEITGTAYSKKLTFNSTAHDNQAFDFRFFEAGTYTFTVSETKGDIAGVTYDKNSYTVTFNVEPDSKNGNRLTVTRTIKQDGAPITGGTITFKNTYQATGTWTPTVAKQLEGRAWQKGEEFEFTLTCTETPDGVANPLPTPDTISVGKDNAEVGVSFGEVTFTKPGDYTFTITETAPGAGITVDSAGKIDITVKAKDNGDGTLNLTVTGEGGTSPEPGKSEGKTTVTFVNAYNEKGTFNIAIQKTLEGRKWSSDDQFKFTVKLDDAAKAAVTDMKLTVPGAWGEQDRDGNYSVTVKEDNKDTSLSEAARWVLGTLNVSGLKTEGGQYVFTVTEDMTGFEEKHLVCLQPEIVLTVTAESEKDASGRYTGTVLTYAYLGTTDPGEHIGSDYTYPVNITNRYLATTGATFNVKVDLTGRPENKWLGTDNFDVTVKYNGNAADLSNVRIQDKNTGKYVEFTEQSRTFTSREQEESLNFGFLAAGTYTFTVSETKGNIAGVTYDENTYTVTFTVTNDGGDLTVAREITPTGKAAKATRAAEGDTITFINTYKASGTWAPTVTKTLNGRAWQKNEEFVFTLSCTESDGVTLPADTRISVGEGETKGFDKVTFTKPGEYHFTIQETGTGAGLGKTTELGAIELTVKVKDNTIGGLIIESVTGKGGTIGDTAPSGTDASTPVTFVNTYSEEGTFDIAIAKTLTGRAWTADDSFKFTITPDKETQDAITNGTLEVPRGWLPSPYTVTVKGTAGGDAAQILTLGTLRVKGQNGEAKQYVFTIEEVMTDFDSRALYCAQPKVQLTVTVSPKMDGGKFTGDYEYTATYAYLDEEGKLGDPSKESSDITVPFTNKAAATADPVATGSSLTIGKTLTGRNWLAGESYTVEVKFNSGEAENVRFSEDGATYHELSPSFTHDFTSTDGTAPSDWKLSFRFFEAGTYQFKVTEDTKNPARAGVTYDKTEYTVTFKVEDKDGTLKVTRSITSVPAKIPRASADIVFINAYIPKHATWTPSVTKVLNGREWASHDSFTFELALAGDSPDKDGVKGIPSSKTITSAVDNTAKFNEVTFTKAGTYKFTVRETNKESAITAGTYTITVTVTDDPSTGKLKLTFDPEYKAEGTDSADGWRYTTATEFVNTYSQEPGEFTLALQKTLSGRAWNEDDTFTFTITPDGAAKTAIQEKTMVVRRVGDG